IRTQGEPADGVDLPDAHPRLFEPVQQEVTDQRRRLVVQRHPPHVHVVVGLPARAERHLSADDGVGVDEVGEALQRGGGHLQSVSPAPTWPRCRSRVVALPPVFTLVRVTVASVRIATWNVNSIRARAERVLAWLERSDTDVLLLQETKVKDEQFPSLLFEAAGYEVACHGLN